MDPKRIGVLGFSAGAHLAAALSTHVDRRVYQTIDAADNLSCRPDFAVIVYPGYLALPDKDSTFTPNPDIPVAADTPPSFIVQAEDDPVHVENAVAYFSALKKAMVPAELHIYANGRTWIWAAPNRTARDNLAPERGSLAAYSACAG